jgi:hypothetical protein
VQLGSYPQQQDVSQEDTAQLPSDPVPAQALPASGGTVPLASPCGAPGQMPPPAQPLATHAQASPSAGITPGATLPDSGLTPRGIVLHGGKWLTFGSAPDREWLSPAARRRGSPRAVRRVWACALAFPAVQCAGRAREPCTCTTFLWWARFVGAVRGQAFPRGQASTHGGRGGAPLEPEGWFEPRAPGRRASTGSPMARAAPAGTRGGGGGGVTRAPAGPRPVRSVRTTS